MKVKKKDEGKKSGFDLSKLEPYAKPFIRKVQTLIKYCGEFNVLHVLAKSTKYGLKLNKMVRSYHKNQQKLAFDDGFLNGLKKLEFKLQDIKERAKQEIEGKTIQSMTRDYHSLFQIFIN